MAPQGLVMNDAVRSLVSQLERTLRLPFHPEGSGARPCRAGELYRIRMGERAFALKVYDEGYFNARYVHDALVARGLPVPAMLAWDDGSGALGRPWILMDWVDGNGRVTDLRGVARQVGQLLHTIHAVAVDGAGGRHAGGWERSGWYAFVDVEAERDRLAVGRLDDTDENRALYLAIVGAFVAFGREQPDESFLLHGDPGLDNVIVDDDRVVALIDPGWCVGGHPLLDVSYLMNSRLGEGAGPAGFFEGYGDPGPSGRRALPMLRLYQLVGKLIHFSATGQREKYEQRRRVLLELAAATPLERAVRGSRQTA